MGTKKEQTLELKDFRGVSRYFASPNEPPNKLFTIQNLYSPNRGELAYLPGITSSSLAADGYSNIIADFNYNGQRLLFNKTTVGVLPNPQAGDFSFSSSGGATAGYFRIGFVGMGYETDIANSAEWNVTSMLAATSSGACGVVMTLNNNALPNSISAINVYISDGGNTDSIDRYLVCATIYRNNKGVFPATYTFYVGLPVYDSVAPSVGQVYKCWQLQNVLFTPKNVAGGTLTPGQTYYFGFAPYVFNPAWSGGTTPPPIYYGGGVPYYPTVQQTYWQSSTYIAYTLPNGYNAINLSEMTVSSLWDGVAGHIYYNAYIFCGSSLEDMVFAQWIPGTNTAHYYTGPTELANLESGTGCTVTGLSHSHNNSITMLPAATQVDAGTSTVRWGMFVPTQQVHTPGAESVACLAFPEGALDYSVSASSCYQINPCRGYGRYSNDGNQLNDTISVAVDLFRVFHGGSSTDILQGASIGGSTKRSTRFFMVNNFQTPFYTDGTIFKQVCQDNNTSIPPICANIITFQNQLVMGGGPTGYQNVHGNIYWTQVDSAGNPNPFAFSPVVNPPVINAAALLGDSSGDILGFGIFSYNQSVNSVTTQLVIGLTNSVWMTPSLTVSGPQEVARSIGFAGPNAFVNTNVGAFFVGRDNLYQLNTYGLPVPKGQDFLSVITAMLKSNTPVPPRADFHNNQIKIMYHTSATDPTTGSPLYDTEIWCDVQLERIEQFNSDVPRMVWTGPHTTTQVLMSAVFPSGIYTDISSSLEGFRTGTNSTKSFILGYPGKTSNQGANVQRVIEFNDLYLGVDDFIKIFTRIYIGGKSTATTTMTVTFNMTDQNGGGNGGTGAPTSYSDTMTINPNAVSAYYQAQKLLATRYRGRIVSNLSFTWNAGSVEETMNIYEIALLFMPQQRRRL